MEEDKAIKMPIYVNLKNNSLNFKVLLLYKTKLWVQSTRNTRKFKRQTGKKATNITNRISIRKIIVHEEVDKSNQQMLDIVLSELARP